MGYDLVEELQKTWSPRAKKRLKKLEKEIMGIVYDETGWVIQNIHTGKVEHPENMYKTKRDCKITIESTYPDGMYKPVHVRRFMDLI